MLMSFWGLLVHLLGIFPKIRFLFVTSSKLMILFQPNVLYMFPVTVHTKFISCNFEILNLQKKNEKRLKINIANCSYLGNG